MGSKDNLASAVLRDGEIEGITSSVSTVKLNKEQPNDYDELKSGSDKPGSPSSTADLHSRPHEGPTSVNPVGNLNLPHISIPSQPSSSLSMESIHSSSTSVFGKVGNKLSLEDLEILSTIGTGTFGRVVLVKERHTKEYFALKVMKIADVIRLKQVEHVKNEKLILTQIQHPFIVQLYWAHHDNTFLYMLLEFVCGGELFLYLRNAGRFNNVTSLFYASEIVSALDYLHGLHIVYRDLKPENILLDRDGHTKLTDFGFAKKVEDRTWTLCGTPEYLAPEVIQSKGHGKSVDWWALGIIIYEMLAGYPPFWDESPFGIYQKILGGKIDFPKHFEDNARDLVKKLLISDRTRRIGNMKNGADDVKRHKWFRTIDWLAVCDKKMLPPIIPKVRHSGDTRNFEDYPEENWRATQPASATSVSIFTEF